MVLRPEEGDRFIVSGSCGCQLAMLVFQYEEGISVLVAFYLLELRRLVELLPVSLVHGLENEGIQYHSSD